MASEVDRVSAVAAELIRAQEKTFQEGTVDSLSSQIYHSISGVR